VTKKQKGVGGVKKEVLTYKYTDPIASNCLILDLWIVPGTNQIKVKTSEGDFPLDYFLTRLPSIPKEMVSLIDFNFNF
jgi:hypothetical protein